MNKWLERVKKRQIEEPERSLFVVHGGFEEEKIFPETPKSNTDNVDNVPILDHLTESERQAYQGWYEVMVGEKFSMSPEEAHKKAWSLLQKTSALLAEKHFKRVGFVKIYSADFGRHIYLCKNESTRTPNKNIPVFTVDEIKDFSTLSREDAVLLAEAKAIFNPMAIFQNE